METAYTACQDLVRTRGPIGVVSLPIGARDSSRWQHCKVPDNYDRVKKEASIRLLRVIEGDVRSYVVLTELLCLTRPDDVHVQQSDKFKFTMTAASINAASIRLVPIRVVGVLCWSC